MKKYLLLGGAILISLIWTMAAYPDWLVCDPQAGVTIYKLEINGAVVSDSIPAEEDGSIKYNLDGLAVGNYTFRAAAGAADSNGTMWWSDWSDPFSASKPGQPGSLRIITNGL